MSTLSLILHSFEQLWDLFAKKKFENQIITYLKVRGLRELLTLITFIGEPLQMAFLPHFAYFSQRFLASKKITHSYFSDSTLARYRKQRLLLICYGKETYNIRDRKRVVKRENMFALRCHGKQELEEKSTFICLVLEIEINIE